MRKESKARLLVLAAILTTAVVAGGVGRVTASCPACPDPCQIEAVLDKEGLEELMDELCESYTCDPCETELKLQADPEDVLRWNDSATESLCSCQDFDAAGNASEWYDCPCDEPVEKVEPPCDCETEPPVLRFRRTSHLLLIRPELQFENDGQELVDAVAVGYLAFRPGKRISWGLEASFPLEDDTVSIPGEYGWYSPEFASPSKTVDKAWRIGPTLAIQLGAIRGRRDP